MTNIWSEDQLQYFYDNILKDLGPTETDFFCLAARRKYMTEREKETINLGDTCMMNKTILKEHNLKKFLSKVHQADVCCDYFTDRDDNYLPRHIMTFYVNINHTNVLSAIRDFKKLVADWDYDVASLTDFKNHNKVVNIGKQLKTIQNNLLKSFQDPKNTNKDWIDIDCDLVRQSAWVLPDSDEETFFLEWPTLLKERFLKNFGLSTYVVKTQGGCHVLINHDCLSEANRRIAENTADKRAIRDTVITLGKVTNLISEFFKEHNQEPKEIVVNQNMMIPLPGTFQNGFPVTMY